MNQKQVKKIRQMFNRRYNQEFFKTIIQGQFFQKFLKPKPRWCPSFLWRLLLKLMINFDFKNGS